jgi:hypothetical protein
MSLLRTQSRPYARLGDDIFIHFLEHEILEMVGRKASYGAEAVSALRLSLLAAERVVIPATAYWEDQWAPPLLERFGPFRQAGRLQLIGTAANPEEYLALKREHYARDRNRYRSYFEEPSRAEYERLSEMWRMRVRSTTADIATGWTQGLGAGDVLFEQVLNRPGGGMRLEQDIARVPQWLGPAAFIADFVVGALGEHGVVIDPQQKGLISRIINRDYVSSYVEELGATVLVGGPTKAVDSLLADTRLRFDVTRFQRMLADLNLADTLVALQPEELLRARESIEWRATRSDLLARAARSGDVWSPGELEVLAQIEAGRFSDPLDVWRGVCDEYTQAMQAAEHRRIAEEAELEGRRKGSSYNLFGGSHDLRGAHFGDDHSTTISADTVTITGGRLQIGGRAVDLYTAAPQEIERGVIELLGRTNPDEVVQQLEAMSGAVAGRDDIDEKEVAEAVAQAFGGPREHSVTERLKLLAGKIGEEAMVGAASGGLTTAALEGLKLLGLG